MGGNSNNNDNKEYYCTRDNYRGFTLIAYSESTCDYFKIDKNNTGICDKGYLLEQLFIIMRNLGPLFISVAIAV